MTSPSEEPAFEELVEDLRLLRRHGLVRLRRLRLAALERLAVPAQLPALGQPSAPAQPPAPPALQDAVETLLRDAVVAFGGGSLGEAASYTFGLAQGTRDWPAQDRRRRAAQVYGVSVERFRKHQEQTVFEQVAEQIFRAARRPATAGAPTPELHAAGAAGRGTAVAPIPFGTRVILAYPVAGGAAVPVVVDVVTAELVTDIDIVVSPTNVHLEPAKTFSATVAGQLRAAAARRDARGRITDDVVQRELRDWLEDHGGYGVAVAPGTVVPTSAGALAAQRIGRIYHAAIAVPRPAANDYHVAPETVARAVREVFALARHERDACSRPLSSLCFPLLGAGRGGMAVRASIEVLCWALTRELARDPGWRVHLVVPEPDRAALLVAHLTCTGAHVC